MDELILELKGAFPIKKKLVIRRVVMHDFGSTSFNGKQITICICKGAVNQKETLVHEFAHALEYDKYGDSSHGTRWSRFYAKTYSLMVKND